MAEKKLERMLNENGFQKTREIASVDLHKDLEYLQQKLRLDIAFVAVYKGRKDQHYETLPEGDIQYANYDIYERPSKSSWNKLFKYCDKHSHGTRIDIQTKPTGIHLFILAGILELADKLGKEALVAPICLYESGLSCSVFVL